MNGCLLSRRGPDVVLIAGTEQRLVPWGQRWQGGTAAHWVALTEDFTAQAPLGDNRHRLGGSLREEVAACLLGGHGLPYETGLAAYEAVRREGLLRPGAAPSAEDVRRVLRLPLKVGGRLRRYRFPEQRGGQLAAALSHLDLAAPPNRPVDVREWLLGVPGIGLKTASWIVRNHYGCDDVAVLDVHVMRAGTAAGVFDASWSPSRHYRLAEGFFLSWAAYGDVRAGDLDAVIWSEQAQAARSGRARGAA
jgi:N-glycosylase/DNA lyase